MKKLFLFITVVVCMSLGIVSQTNAAFPIKNQKTTHVAASVTTNATTITEIQKAHYSTSKTLPEIKFKFINPEHPLTDIFSLLSFGLGALGLLLAFVSGIGIIFGIVAIVLGIVGKQGEGYRKLAQWGLAFGILAVVIAVIVSLA